MKKSRIIGFTLFLLILAVMGMTIPVGAQSATATVAPSATPSFTATPAPVTEGIPNAYGEVAGFEAAAMTTIGSVSYPATGTQNTVNVTCEIVDSDGTMALSDGDTLIIGANKVAPVGTVVMPTLQIGFGNVNLNGMWFFQNAAPTVYADYILAWNYRDGWFAINSLRVPYDEERNNILSEVNGAMDDDDLINGSYGMRLWQSDPDLLFWSMPVRVLTGGLTVIQHPTPNVVNIPATSLTVNFSLMVADESNQQMVGQNNVAFDLSTCGFVQTVTATPSPAASQTATLTPAITATAVAMNIVPALGLSCYGDAQNITFAFTAPATTTPTTRYQLAFGSGTLDGWDNWDSNAAMMIRFDNPYLEIVTASGTLYASTSPNPSFVYNPAGVTLTVPRFLIDSLGANVSLTVVESTNGVGIVAGRSATTAFNTATCVPSGFPSPTPPASPTFAPTATP